MKRFATTMLIIFISIFARGQSNYWIFLKNSKNDTSISANHSINAHFLKIIADHKIQVIGTSKWFNAIYVTANTTSSIEKIKKLPFVKGVEGSRKYHTNLYSTHLFDSLNYGQADVQLNMLGLQNYHRKGFTGKGITIALFDGGFYGVDSNLAFDSLRKRQGILATRDFYDNDFEVYKDDAHGMHVLSLISGFVKDSLNGSAPDANFLLARTEFVQSEKHIEEFNWIRALEWADSIGVDIIHSSLGYSQFDSLEGNYTYKDMDGQSTIITRAAEMAFKRGIFITNSAGNEGKTKWRYITAPCDGKNVLCIGAVDSFEKHADFSSFGPSSDGRIKPDVMAMGKKVTIIGTNNQIRVGSGTSFSGPIMAGFVACLKQSFPNVNNTIILEAIRKSGHLYNNPNDSMGYGIPNIVRADSLIKLKLQAPNLSKYTIKIYPNPCQSWLTFESKTKLNNLELTDVLGKKYYPQIENNTINLSDYKSGIYFIHIDNFIPLKIVKL